MDINQVFSQITSSLMQLLPTIIQLMMFVLIIRLLAVSLAPAKPKKEAKIPEEKAGKV